MFFVSRMFGDLVPLLIDKRRPIHLDQTALNPRWFSGQSVCGDITRFSHLSNGGELGF
jgi:hypothetical protein